MLLTTSVVLGNILEFLLELMVIVDVPFGGCWRFLIGAGVLDGVLDCCLACR